MQNCLFLKNPHICYNFTLSIYWVLEFKGCAWKSFEIHFYEWSQQVISALNVNNSTRANEKWSVSKQIHLFASTLLVLLGTLSNILLAGPLKTTKGVRLVF